MRGIEALAAVIMNRATVLAGRFGRGGLPELCLLERRQSQPVADAWAEARVAGSAGELLFTTCLRIARRAVAGLLEDPTGGATHVP